MEDFWSLLKDKCVCINLRERPDRLASVNQEFQRVGLTGVRYYHPNKHPNSGRNGCYESHRFIAMAAYKADLPYVCIFEDDVRFLTERITPEASSVLQSVLKSKYHWDILYLGHSPVYIKPTHQKGLVKCRSVNTQAYILSRSGMEKLMNRPYKRVPVDISYALSYECLALNPIIARQAADSTSDIGFKLFSPKMFEQQEKVGEFLVGLQEKMGQYYELKST